MNLKVKVSHWIFWEKEIEIDPLANPVLCKNCIFMRTLRDYGHHTNYCVHNISPYVNPVTGESSWHKDRDISLFAHQPIGLHKCIEKNRDLNCKWHIPNYLKEIDQNKYAVYRNKTKGKESSNHGQNFFN